MCIPDQGTARQAWQHSFGGMTVHAVQSMTKLLALQAESLAVHRAHFTVLLPVTAHGIARAMIASGRARSVRLTVDRVRLRSESGRVTHELRHWPRAGWEGKA